MKTFIIASFLGEFSTFQKRILFNKNLFCLRNFLQSHIYYTYTNIGLKVSERSGRDS